MANNRMYLRCKKCGETLFLGKTFLDGYYTDNDFYENGSLLNSLNIFYDNHKWCDKQYKEEKFYEPKFKETDFNEENSFEICYETYYDLDKEEKENGDKNEL